MCYLLLSFPIINALYHLFNYALYISVLLKNDKNVSAQTSPYLSQFIQGKIIARSMLVNLKETSMLNKKRVPVQKQYTYNNIYKSYMQSQ